jgi:arylformamidase
MVGVRLIFIIPILLGISSIVAAQSKKDEGPFIAVRNIRYATHKGSDPKRNTLDIYMPKKGSNSPVIVFIHGGAWEFGDKAHVQDKPAYFTSRGYIFVSINYRLSPEVKHPAHVQDVAHAIAWLYENVRHYSGDKNNIFLMGHSAGAHLAALVSTDEQYLRKAHAKPEVIKATVLLDGAGYDMVALMPEIKGKLKEWYEQAFGTKRDEWRAASPVTYIQAGHYYPKFLVLYAGEREASAEEAKILANKLTGAGAQCQLIHYPEENHMSLNRSLGREGDKPTEDILRFLLTITSPYPTSN